MQQLVVYLLASCFLHTVTHSKSQCKWISAIWFQKLLIQHLKWTCTHFGRHLDSKVQYCNMFSMFFSTLSSILSASAAVIMEDLIRPWRPNISDKHTTIINKVLAVIMGFVSVATVILAKDFGNSIISVWYTFPSSIRLRTRPGNVDCNEKLCTCIVEKYHLMGRCRDWLPKRSTIWHCVIADFLPYP